MALLGSKKLADDLAGQFVRSYFGLREDLVGRAPNVVIVVARCSAHKQLLGIRFQETDPNRWEADWAFPLKENTARRQGYDRGEIAGRFVFAGGYPGCPYCRAPSIFKCGRCGKVACWDGVQRTVVCPWCGNGATLSGTIESMAAGGDR